MKNFKTGALYLLFGSLLLGGSGSIALAQDDVLSAPTPTGSQLKGIQSRPVSPAQPAALAEPPDVVGQNGQAAPVATSLPTPSASTTPAPVSKASPVPTVSKPAKPLPTPTRTPALRSEKTATPTPTPNRTTTPVVTPKLPRITTIPNPAYGDKVIFRVMAKVPSKAQVVVYDRFFTKVTQLSGEGDRLFDILWSLKKVQQGLYYYQTQITDSATGQTQMLPMQSFAVMKDDNPDEP